ncbi:glycoside hydrolase [Auricularia subglabra TFB-10046 SS5]|uniref:glucan 1,3-beta-glucosidase n=1 Tax=Auricularia subglabra (strain TFB-10046 / SS5) TaxID=717982 RepID=J0D0H7_AURST|nr:glycoside hydrolase [Auricularia subglabra TFB-10046 SS5]
MAHHSYNPSLEDVGQHLQPGDAYRYPPRPTHQRTDSNWSDHTITAPLQQSPLIKPVPYSDDAAITPMQSQDQLSYNYGASRDGLNQYAGYNNAYNDRAAPAWSGGAPPPRKSRKRMIILIAGGIILLVIVIAVVVYFAAIKPKNDKNGSGGKKNNTASNVRLVVGRDGTEVKTGDGRTFTYKNPHGGWFIDDPVNPYNDGAKAQSWTPALNETWKYGKDKIFGGWLVPEPFIAPALYEKYFDDQTVNGDEWTLSAAMRADVAGGGINQMEDHYRTFITEEDFAQIAGAGLNWIRLPIPFNAFGTLEGEPYLPNVAWDYVLKAFKWARKYGIRLNLDLHSMPGGQNGLNHSGIKGSVAWLAGVMGYANTQRSLNFVRGLTEFISQDEYKNLIPIISIVNEPQGQDRKTLEEFYLEAYKMIRGITGIGEGKGPYIAIHDHFEPVSNWKDFLHGADRLILDTHPYFTFGGQDTPSIDNFPPLPCAAWGVPINASMNSFGLTIAGEWSLGFNDCGQYIWGLRDAPKTTNCDVAWNDYTKWTPETKRKLKSFAMSHMEALGNFFFWTWKVGVSRNTGLVGAPFWSYSLGLQEGWIPTDPREAFGECARLGAPAQPDQYYVGELQPWQTGGTGAGEFAPAATVGLDWPPAQLMTINNLPVPTYTAAGPVPTLPLPTFPPPAQATAKGWANAQDNAPGIVPIANCQYPNPWNPGSSPPNPIC